MKTAHKHEQYQNKPVYIEKSKIMKGRDRPFIDLAFLD